MTYCKYLFVASLSCFFHFRVQENEEMDANDKANGIPPAANNTKITRKA